MLKLLLALSSLSIVAAGIAATAGGGRMPYITPAVETGADYAPPGSRR